MAALPPVERRTVTYIRLWCASPQGQAEVWNDLAVTLGAAEGRAALQAFERYLFALALHARRPLLRHSIRCTCAGADEVAVARLAALSECGASDDALRLAASLVHASGLAEVLETGAAMAAAFGRIGRRPGLAPV